MKFMKMEKCFYRAMTKIDLETLKSIEKLVKMGVRNDSEEKRMLNFSKMDRVKKGWTTNNALFKTEGGNYNIEQVNIGLGKGKALEIFNENIINFEIIK